MASHNPTADMLTPQQLRQITQDVALATRQKAEADARRAQENDKLMRDAFMAKELRHDVLEYLMASARRHAAAGEHEFLALQFPAKLLADGGRKVNNFEEDWPDSLQGFAKRAYDYFLEHLKPAGYHLQARILDYPHGIIGDVGIFLVW